MYRALCVCKALYNKPHLDCTNNILCHSDACCDVLITYFYLNVKTSLPQKEVELKPKLPEMQYRCLTAWQYL